MLIYLKGINGVQLENLLDFFYNGEASVGHEELKEFLDNGKELKLKGFKGDVSGVGESVREEPGKYIDEIKEISEIRDIFTTDDISCDTMETLVKNHAAPECDLKQKYEETIQISENSELNLKIEQIIEKSDGVWKCKVCGRTSKKSTHIQEHAESHIEGMSHACHICDKTLSSRSSLRMHINSIHSELLICDICGKSGMNKSSYKQHKQTRQHKTLSVSKYFSDGK